MIFTIGQMTSFFEDKIIRNLSGYRRRKERLNPNLKLDFHCQGMLMTHLLRILVVSLEKSLKTFQQKSLCFFSLLTVTLTVGALDEDAIHWKDKGGACIMFKADPV